jgi:hypothetical protein
MFGIPPDPNARGVFFILLPILLRRTAAQAEILSEEKRALAAQPIRQSPPVNSALPYRPIVDTGRRRARYQSDAIPSSTR